MTYRGYIGKNNLKITSSFLMNIESRLDGCDEVSFPFEVGENLFTSVLVKESVEEIRESLHKKGYQTKLKIILPEEAKCTTALNNKDIKYELIIYKK